MQAFCDVTLYYLTTVTEREVRYKIIDNEVKYINWIICTYV